MSVKLATTLLALYVEHGIPTFLWGPPGVGKSDTVRDITKEKGWGLIDFRCSTRDPVSLMGLPDVSGDTTRWKVPDEFPQVERDGEYGILFLDELNTAAPSMQAAAFGLVLDRRVGEYTLPDGWMVVAAGNRQSDKAAAQRMPSALANRFAHIDVEPNAEEFAEWANTHGVDPMVMAFVRFRPELIHKMDGDNIRAFPSPRSWAKVAKVCRVPDQTLRFNAVKGLIGEGPAAEFEAFVRLHAKLPSLKSIIEKPDTTPVPEEPAARYAIAIGLGAKMDRNNIGAIITYLGRMPREFGIMAITDATRRDGAIHSTPEFVRWCADNRDILIG